MERTGAEQKLAQGEAEGADELAESSLGQFLVEENRNLKVQLAGSNALGAALMAANDVWVMKTIEAETANRELTAQLSRTLQSNMELEKDISRMRAERESGFTGMVRRLSSRLARVAGFSHSEGE